MDEKEKKPINILIGNNVRKYRELCGYSRETLAEKIKVTPRFIASIEVGVVGVSPSTIKSICEVLGVTSDRILWNNESELGLDERAKHVPPEYIGFLHKSLLTHIEMLEYCKQHGQEHLDNDIESQTEN